MGETLLRRYLDNFLSVVRAVSVEPAFLGFALSYGLVSIVSTELYIAKVFLLNLINTITN